MQNLFDQDPNSDNKDSFNTVEENTVSTAEIEPAEEPALFSFSSPANHSTAETARMSGLAWSTGIVLFGAVILMMLIGWGADLIFGTKPWGMIGGLIIGAIIGFVQLFRTSSEIFRK